MPNEDFLYDYSVDELIEMSLRGMDIKIDGTYSYSWSSEGDKSIKLNPLP